MKNINKHLLILGIILFVIIFERIISITPIFKKLELMTYDIRAKIATDSGPFSEKFKPADRKIVIVAIDDFSRNEISKNPQFKLGSWPWRRSVWADVVKFIEKGKPKAVLFDLIFNDLNENPLNDEKFSQALKHYDNVVLATTLNHPKYLVETNKNSQIENSKYLPTARSINVETNNKKLDDNITFYSHAPVSDIYTDHNTMGVANKVAGEDSIIRYSQPLYKLIKDDKVYYLPSLAFAGFLKYMGEDGTLYIKGNNIFYKGHVIPVNNNGQTLISWHGRGYSYNQNHPYSRAYRYDYDYLPISRLLLSKRNQKYVKYDYFKDKIVIIGRTEAATDLHTSAVNPIYAGPEANATALDNFINDTDLTKSHTRKILLPLSGFKEFLIIISFIGLIIFVGVISKNALISFLNNFIIIILYFLLCTWAFADPTIRLWVPIVVPMYYFLMTSTILFAFRFQKELAKRANVMNTFGKFVSPKVLATILKEEGNLTLKSTRKRITVMFCDVKNFTTISEKSNPEQLVNDLNELFNILVNVIFENNGTVDKFIGDCIMAYWGDPISSEDDAFMAVKTALEIKKKVNELKIVNAQESKIILDVKIGINTGDALMGLSGSDKIMSYTAMGDAVNVASRLESNCSKLNRDILISKSTYDDAKSKIVVIEAGKIGVKGRDEQIEVFEPIGLQEDEN